MPAPSPRPRATIAITVAAALLVAALASACRHESRSATVPRETREPTVVEVVDGDTVVVRMGRVDEHVRLIGVDTPETKHPSKPVECFGREASAFTRAVLPTGTVVRLERDVEERDAYGRLLAYVWRAADGVFVNRELVAQGYAAALTIPPNVRHTDELVSAAARARERGAGLWGACGGPGVPAR
ncbi:MAG: thermonuclease family protein [Acidimicrobiales bacterium]